MIIYSLLMEKFYLPFIEKPRMTFITEHKSIPRYKKKKKYQSLNKSSKRAKKNINSLLHLYDKSLQKVDIIL